MSMNLTGHISGYHHPGTTIQVPPSKYSHPGATPTSSLREWACSYSNVNPLGATDKRVFEFTRVFYRKGVIYVRNIISN